MNIHELAELTSRYIEDNETAAIMAAIAYGESGGRPDAQGDHLESYGAKWFNEYSPYAHNGYNSHGLFQVFMYWHREKLERLTGSKDVAVWANWLHSPDNNMQIALEILANQGFQAWSIYNVGVHKNYLEEARREVLWWRHHREQPTPTEGPNDAINQIKAHLLAISDLLATL